MKEEDIRPKVIFDKYLELAEKDVATFFSDAKYTKRNCPACGRADMAELSFHKKGFDYWVCNNCGTLYTNPLPDQKCFVDYYSRSPSTKFWATDFYKLTEEARRREIFMPRVKMIDDLITEAVRKGNVKKIDNVIEIGAGYGTFAEEMRKHGKYKVHAIEPNDDLANCIEKKGFKNIKKFLEEVEPDDLPGGSSCFTSFELVEHLHDPTRFFKQMIKIMGEDDLFVFTTLSGGGLDILVLWEESKAVHPPHHLNFFNPRSITILLESLGFEVLRITTPGKLDIDILNNNNDKIKDRFWRYFIKNSSEQEKADMQTLIQKSGFSSHMCIVAKKAANR